MRKTCLALVLACISVIVSNSLAAQCPAGAVTLTSQADIDNFSTTYPGCTVVNGLTIDGTNASPAITNLNALSVISGINGDLQIINTSVTELSPLNNITVISGKLIVRNNPSLTLLGLFNIHSLGGIHLTSVPALNNISGLSNNITSLSRIEIDTIGSIDLNDGLEGIAEVNGDLIIKNSHLTSLSGMTNLTKVMGLMIIEHNPGLTEIGLNNLTQAGLFIFNDLPVLTSLGQLSYHLTNTNMGTLLIGNTALTDLSGLDSLTSVPNFYISGNPNLLSLHGLEKLSGNISGGISIWGNNSLTDISALNNITSINDGRLEVSLNSSLTNLAGLGNITNIKNGLWIQGNPNLTNLSDLNPDLIIENEYGDKVIIRNNQNLAVCSFQPLCNYLNANNEAEIDNNAAGCNSIAEVLAACGTCTAPEEATWTGNEDDQWNNAANWSTGTVPNSCTKVIMHEGSPSYPNLSSNVTIHGLIMEQNTAIYLNGFTLTNTETMNLEHAEITGNGVVNASRIINGRIKNSFIQARLNYIDFSGQTDISDNGIEGEAIFSDSTGRADGCAINANSFSSDLTVINNSEHGQFYVSNSSPTTNRVIGNFTVINNTNAYISVGLGDPIHLEGDFNVQNTSGGGVDIGRVMFEGHHDSYINQLGNSPIRIEDLFIHKTLGGKIFLNQQVTVTHKADFFSGIVNTEAGKELIFDNNCTVTGGNNYSYVAGSAWKTGNQAFTFPVGDSSFYAPITISAPSSVNDIFSAQYFKRNPIPDHYDTSFHVNGLSNISTKEYWMLYNITANSPSVDVTLSFDRLRSGTLPQLIDLKVAHWSGTQWLNEGNGGTTGDTTTATVKTAVPVNSYGPFTLAFPHTYVPIITIGTVNSSICRGTNFDIPFTVDSPMIVAVNFIAQLSDASGSFANPWHLGLVNGTSSNIIHAFMPLNVPGGNGYRMRIVTSNPADTSVNIPGITVLTLPLQGFNITGATQTCSGNQVYASSTPEAGVTYTWTLSGGGSITPNGASATITWTAPGSYTLTVQTSTACGSGPQRSIGITVNSPAPTATPVITNSGRWLYSTAAPFSSPGATTYQWYNNHLAIAGANSSSYYAAAAGNYTVKYSNYCGTGPESNILSFGTSSSPQTISFPSIADKTYGDAPFAVEAIASSGLPVSFSVVSGPASIPGNVLTITGTGLVTLRAMQPGNDLYDTAAPVTRSFMVNKASQTITFDPITDKIYGTGNITLQASTTSGLPIAYSIVSGPATISGNVIILTGTGTVTVRASQNGNANYFAATPVDRSFCSKITSLGNISGYSNVCPVTTSYSVTNVQGAIYTWKIIGGSTLPSSTNTTSVNWTTPGNYLLTVSATADCGTTVAGDTLQVSVVNNIQPDSVHNMLPANGTTGLQLPLQFSWIPANPELFYTFDLYIWRADLPQPATPFAANLNTVNYTLPATSGLLYNQTYKWMVVAHNGSCTQINTGPVQEFSLRPLPDMNVSDVQSAATAFSGQTVSVTWKITNAGPGNTILNQSWIDAVFIAKDSVLDFTNPADQLVFPVVPLMVKTVPNLTALDAGLNYTNSASFTIPVSYSGPLYVHVITNYSATLTEVTTANDTARTVAAIAVTLSPTPDLRADSVASPNNTFSGSTVNVQYKVKNHGVNAGGSWTDKIYLSKDPLFNINTAIQLKAPNASGSYYTANDAVHTHTSGLLHDSSYTVNIPVVIPNFIFGPYYIYVITNSNATLYEGASIENNTGQGNLMQIFLTPTPKLVPVNIAVPDSAGTTQSITFNWNIENQGSHDNYQKNQFPFDGNGSSWGFSSWTDKVYLSTDSSALNTANAIFIGSFARREIILPLTLYPDDVTWRVPANLAPGTYYLYVHSNTDKTVFEYPGTTQIKRSNGFVISRPDLTVPLVTAPANGNSGQPVTLNYTILNTGAGAVYNYNRKDYIYLGSNPVFDASAQLIDSVVSNASVPVNISQSLQKQVTIPNGLSGVKYFFVRANADSLFKENNLNNNINTNGAAISILLAPAPDFIVSSISMGNTVFSSLGFPFKSTMINSGGGTASGAWTDSLFVSCNAVYSPGSSYFIGTRNQQSYVPASGSYSDSFNLKLPYTFLINNAACLNSDTVHIYFFVKTNARKTVYENNFNNNVLGTTQKTVINALVDHTVTNVSSADSAVAGRPFKVSWTVKNKGYNPADETYYSWKDEIYLSADTILGAGDVTIGGRNQSQRLDPEQSYTDSMNCNIINVADGYYYLIVRDNTANTIIAERNLSNNTGLKASRIYVSTPLLPDLADSIITAPASIAVGQPVTVVYTVKNNGAGTTYPSTWSDNLWLSNSLQQGGLYLGSKIHSGALLPGQSYTDSFTATIPVNYTAGNYVLVVTANYGNSVYETGYSNNNDYHFISVYAPAPSDLVVNNINVADTLVLGYPANISWDLSNISTNPTNGRETDGIYLSTDSLAGSANDILTGIKLNQLNILPLNAANINSQPLIDGITEGSYFVKIKADILNNILESNKQNNTGITGHKVYIKVKQLPLNIIMPDTLKSNYLYYKLIVPPSLAGKTISVKLTSSDSLIANNQMYIGLGYLPSAARFDYAYGSPNAGNQQIIIESVTDSVYYIAAKGTKPNNGTQLITLQAVELPFAVLNVNSGSGGNTGNVTVLIKGSLFSNNMQASIRRISSGSIINASAVYFVNTTTVYATFNLQGAPLGAYDVTLRKPDASIATLPSGFTVVVTNNGGLLTGTNTGQTGSGNQPGCDPGAGAGLNSQLLTEIIYPPKVFASWPFVIQINYVNASNVDIPAQAKILYSLSGTALSFTEAGLSERKTTLYIEFKDDNGPPGIIRAGGSGTIKIYSKAPANAQAHSLIHYNLQ